MSENYNRSILVLFTCVALVVVVSLAAVINRTTFDQLNFETTLIEGDPLPIRRDDAYLSEAVEWSWFDSDARLPIEYALFAMLLTTLWLLFTEKGRKRLASVLSITLFVVIYRFYFIGKSKGFRIKRTNPDDVATQDIAVVEAEWIGDWFTWIIALLISLAVLGAFYWAWRRWFVRPPAIDDEIATVAQTALDELDAGASLEDVIRWSYEAMQTAVRNHRQLNRRVAMTVREFEERLVANELPIEAVHDLTRLFERVRYGSYTATARDEQVARSALQAIVTAIGG